MDSKKTKTSKIKILIIALSVFLTFTSNHAFSQSATSSISGTVMSTEGANLIASLRIYSVDSPDTTLQEVTTDSNGKFSISNLVPGDYLLHTLDARSKTRSYVNQVYGNIACQASTCDISLGQKITITAGNSVSDIDFRLQSGSEIKGKIKGKPHGSVTEIALQNVEVLLYDISGKLIDKTISDQNGSYAFEGLSATAYYMSTINNLGFIDQVYRELPCPGSKCNVLLGKPIELSTSEISQTLNFTLNAGGLISGKISSATSSIRMSNSQVFIYDSHGNFVLSTRSDSKGNFLIGAGLVEGIYFVTAKRSGYIRQLYGYGECVILSKCPITQGIPVMVQPNKISSNIDFSLYFNSKSPSLMDSDNDGVRDYKDGCDLNPKKVSPGVCGCEMLDQDKNANGVMDCLTNSEIKLELKNILKNIKRLKPLRFKNIGKQSSLRGNISSNNHHVIKTAKRGAKSIQLKAGTLVDFFRAQEALTHSVRKLLRKEGSLKSELAKVRRNVQVLNDLLS
jgi:Carboxypeptidase regulatory-like domain